MGNRMAMFANNADKSLEKNVIKKKNKSKTPDSPVTNGDSKKPKPQLSFIEIMKQKHDSATTTKVDPEPEKTAEKVKPKWRKPSEKKAEEQEKLAASRSLTPTITVSTKSISTTSVTTTTSSTTKTTKTTTATKTTISTMSKKVPTASK